MHEVTGGVGTDTPGPDVAAPMGVFFVLTVPIVGRILLVVEYLEAVGFNFLTLGVFMFAVAKIMFSLLSSKFIYPFEHNLRPFFEIFITLNDGR